MRVGVVAPLSGPLAPLGEQVRSGAQAAAGGNAGMAAADVEMFDEGCTAERGAAVAREMVAARVTIVVGFLCTESVEAALPVLTQAGIPVVSPGVRTNSLTDQRYKTGWLFYRVAPRASHEMEAAAALVASRWKDTLFALVDDGTIYGRELVEAIRFATEQVGMKPAFIDTFRPQLDNQIALVGRLRKAGATHVFVGGDRDDIAIIARDAADLDYSLEIAGGESLRAAGLVPLPDGVLMVALPDADATDDNVALSEMRRMGVEPEGYVLPAFAAMQIARAATAAGSPLPALAEDRFDTVLGAMKFDSKGDLSTNPYRVFRSLDGTFRPLD